MFPVKTLVIVSRAFGCVDLQVKSDILPGDVGRIVATDCGVYQVELLSGEYAGKISDVEYEGCGLVAHGVKSWPNGQLSIELNTATIVKVAESAGSRVYGWALGGGVYEVCPAASGGATLAEIAAVMRAAFPLSRVRRSRSRVKISPPMPMLDDMVSHDASWQAEVAAGRSHTYMQRACINSEEYNRHPNCRTGLN